MTSSYSEDNIVTQQRLLSDNDASAAIEWSALIPEGTQPQFYDAELNQRQDKLLLTGQEATSGTAYEIDLDGTLLRRQALTTFRGTDVIAGPDQESWHAGGFGVNGNPNGTATLAWNHLDSGSNIAVLASTGIAYNFVDGFNFGGKILDLYANYSLAPHQLDIRIDGEPFASAPLDLIPLAAAWNSGNKELYVVGWPSTGARTSFELYKTDLNNHFWPTGFSTPWTHLSSFTGPSLGTAPSAAPWSEAYIDSLIWDEATESLLFSGSSAVYDNSGNPVNAGFVSSYSPLSGISHEIIFPQNSPLKKFTSNKIAFINSAHHQGVDKLGNNLIITGTAPDGIIEGFEHQSHYYCVGVQWHPEFLITDFDKKFIQDFVNHVKKNI